jgi:hypothetical protein
MATSSGLFVTVMLPWVNCCATSITLVPMPIALAPAPFNDAA